jgi:hypothetical protein
MSEETKVEEVRAEPAVNNSFLQCPKCLRLHDARVLVCENLKCAFTHLKIEVAADPAEKGVEASVSASVGTTVADPATAAVTTTSDPVEAPGTAP